MDCPDRKILDHYLHLFQSTRVAGRNLAVAFFMGMGCTDPAERSEIPLGDPRTASDEYLKLMIQVPLSIAAKLLDPQQGIEYRRALGIKSREDLLACIAVVLYLRQDDPVLGPWASKLVSAPPKDLVAGKPGEDWL